MEFLPTESEKIMYLTSILDSEQILKAQLASDIHAKKTDIYCIEMALSAIISAIEMNEKPTDKLEVLKQSAITLLGEMNDLYEEHLLNPAAKYSPSGRLNVCIRKLAAKFDGKIDFETNITNESGIEQKWEMPYYLACSHAIEIICHYGYRAIDIELIMVENEFQIFIEGKEQEKTEIDTLILEDRLNKLKGVLIWKKGKVHHLTDWKSFIAFNFTEISK